MKITEDQIKEALKVWDAIDEENIEVVYSKFSGDQPVLVDYLNDSFDDYDMNPELEDELFELAYIVYLAFKQANKNFPKVTPKTLDEIEDEEEKNFQAMLEKLGISPLAPEDEQFEAMDKFNIKLSEAMEKSPEDLQAFIKQHDMEDLFEEMFNQQPVLEQYLQQEFDQMDENYSEEELGLAYDIMLSYINILSKTLPGANLKIVK